MYRASYEQTMKDQQQYNSTCSGRFTPYTPAPREKECIYFMYEELLKTQNGSGMDDYVVEDNNKVENYLSDYPKGTRVLLLGTGTGREVVVAKDLGLDVVGTTFGSKNVEFGRNILGLGDNELIECNNDALPFFKETFDVVAGFQVFEHCISPLMFLLEQARVLKTGGRLILEWPPAAMFNMEGNPHHQICYAPGQAKALFEKAGFSQIRLYYSDWETIPEDQIWRADQIKMMCIDGIKSHSSQEYISKTRSFR